LFNKHTPGLPDDPTQRIDATISVPVSRHSLPCHRHCRRTRKQGHVGDGYRRLAKRIFNRHFIIW